MLLTALRTDTTHDLSQKRPERILEEVDSLLVHIRNVFRMQAHTLFLFYIAELWREVKRLAGGWRDVSNVLE